MGAALMRASFSANIKERRDFSCALFDGHGRMLAQAANLPVHLGSQPMSVAAAIEAVDMRPGIHVILNDPYAGGTHLPDITLVSPVYLPGHESGRPAFYVSNRAHHADIGGKSPGSMPSPRNASGDVEPLTIDDEGWRCAPTILDDAVRDSLCAASRTPDERLGDLRAQEAANIVGARRLIEMVEAMGPEALEARNEAVLAYSERRMRAVIAALPDGDYRFEDALDDDGTDDRPVPIPVTLRIAGDSARVDFSQAPDSVPGAVNAVRAIAVAAVAYVFRCLGGADVPANEGLMRPIEVITREGSLCDARAPAAVSAGNVETSQRLVDVLYGALAQAAPDRIPAASGGTMNNVLFGGTDTRPGPRQGTPYVHYETLACGAGGSAVGPGASAIQTHMTNTLNTPIEELERLFPVRITRYALRPSPPTAEPDDTPGGAGVVRAYTFLADTDVTLISDRRRLAPWGLGGAAGGQPGRNLLRRTDGTESALPGKVQLSVSSGDTVVVETPSGGGWRPARS
ncbi:MAG: hydantoinase B/oxoprolinase family protein [Myxococcota bacterium]